MAKVFISYRRDDTEGHAGRLYDRLVSRFGRLNVFRDIDSLTGGQDFVEALDGAIGSCDVLLAIIGRNWLDAKDEHGQRRLDNPNDFVRREIGAGLKAKIRVVPVLVQRASMPSEPDLPPDLALLARRQSVEIGERFDQDVESLLDTIGGNKWFSSRRYLLFAAVAIVIAGAAVAAYVVRGTPMRRLEAIAVDLRYDKPKDQVVAAISELRRVAVQNGSPRIIDAAVQRLKSVVVDARVKTDDGRAIRRTAMEALKTLRRQDLTRDFAAGELKASDLVRVDLSRVNLRGVNLEKAFLIYTDFNGSDLSGANLTGAWVRNADFAAVTLKGTDLTSVDWFNALDVSASNLGDSLRKTVDPCPKDAAGRFSEAAFRREFKEQYDYEFDDFSDPVKAQLLRTWKTYAEPGGLCETVGRWQVP